MRARFAPAVIAFSTFVPRTARPFGGLPLTVLLVVASVFMAGWSRGQGASSQSTPAAASQVPASSPIPPLVSTVQSVGDSTVTLSTPDGQKQFPLAPFFKVYDRVPSDLSHIKETSFVGVTSVPQPDGSQKATEIHVFDEALRGLGEGSRSMEPPGAGGRTMTNGSVSTSRMTNGTVRRSTAGSTIIVSYNGGTQTITVPPDVEVTSIEPISREKLVPGTNAFVVLARQPGGTVWATAAMLIKSPPAKP
jgi:hypothetical protein